MDHGFGGGGRVRGFLVRVVGRLSGRFLAAYLDWNRHRRRHIDGNIVLGGRRRAWRDRDSSETPSVGLGCETIAETPLARRRVRVTATSDSPASSEYWRGRRAQDPVRVKSHVLPLAGQCFQSLEDPSTVA